MKRKGDRLHRGPFQSFQKFHTLHGYAPFKTFNAGTRSRVQVFKSSRVL
jgi:hypothetical protein